MVFGCLGYSHACNCDCDCDYVVGGDPTSFSAGRLVGVLVRLACQLGYVVGTSLAVMWQGMQKINDSLVATIFS